MRLSVLLFALLFALPAAAQPRHGLAMHGALKYPAGFAHFDYVNPAAPKGGELKLADTDPFDSFNPYIAKGMAPDRLQELAYDTLMEPSQDEPFSMYGLVAESVEVPPDRSWVLFTLRKQARFHDGKPMTPDDVIFSLDVLRTKGAPTYRFYYAAIDKAEKVGELGVKFTFKPGDNRELPLILGELPVLPKHYWQGRAFEETTLEPPLSSGPYRIGKFEAGRFVTYERVKDYWAKDLPVRKGHFNFDRVRIDVYRDSTVALEALKAGEYDVRPENEAKKWAAGYDDWAALKDGRARKDIFAHQRPAGMQGFSFNLRRPMFADIKVREALSLAFDFEWANRTLFSGQYTRTRSYFDNSELAASGPPGPMELAILEPLRGQVPERVFGPPFTPPVTDGSGYARDALKRAMRLLEEAGWQVVDGALVDKSGKPFEFEVLLNSPAFERIALPWARNLARLGIKANVRTVDSTQYVNRVRGHDFDVIVMSWGASASPGNEQASYWTSQAADQKGARNFGGIKNPAVDRLVELVISAPDREQLVARTRALDRVLTWNHYVVPQWHIPYDRVAYWDKFGRPDQVPSKGWQLHTWWMK